MNQEQEPIVKVHIHGSSLPQRKRREKRTVFNTVVLTASEPVQEILPKSENRVCAYVQAIDNDIILTTSLGQGQAKGNTAANVPFPSGMYLPSKSNGGAIFPFRIDGNDLIFAAATTTGSNSRVAVSATYYCEDY